MRNPPAGAVHRSRVVVAIALIGTIAGCTEKTPFAGLAEARRLAADLQVDFTKAADASNRAVMADTDEASIAYAKEAMSAADAVQKKADALASVLNEFGFSDEANQLTEFRGKFSEYRTLDRSVLDLAVENTNLKAQRLSFVAAPTEADTFRAALDALRPAESRNSWQVKALAATALAAVREIQALQAPHIAEADDAAMTRLEQRMAESEAAARRALESLKGLVHPSSRPHLVDAISALDRFMHVNAQIVTLSRRNTNVRSLALSLNQKRVVTAACDAILQAIRDSLAKRSFAGTR